MENPIENSDEALHYIISEEYAFNQTNIINNEPLRITQDKYYLIKDYHQALEDNTYTYSL